VPQKRHTTISWIIQKKWTDIRPNNVRYLGYWEKISHLNVTNLSASPVKCCYCGPTLKKNKKVIFSISCLRRFWDTAYSLEAHSEPSTRDHWNSWHVVGTLKVCFCRHRERLCEQCCTFLYTVASRPTRSSRERPPFETKSLSSAADSLFSLWI